MLYSEQIEWHALTCYQASTVCKLATMCCSTMGMCHDDYYMCFHHHSSKRLCACAGTLLVYCVKSAYSMSTVFLQRLLLAPTSLQASISQLLGTHIHSARLLVPVSCRLRDLSLLSLAWSRKCPSWPPKYSTCPYICALQQVCHSWLCQFAFAAVLVYMSPSEEAFLFPNHESQKLCYSIKEQQKW